MTDLTAWLLEQITEDERLAHKALKAHWDHPSDAPWERARMVVTQGGRMIQDIWAAHCQPTRVLAECAAKRRIIEVHADSRYPYGDPSGICGEDNIDLPCPTLRLLALPYAGRPGYREEWQP